MPKGVGDVLCFDSALTAIVGVVCTDGSVVRDGTAADVHDW